MKNYYINRLNELTTDLQKVNKDLETFGDNQVIRMYKETQKQIILSNIQQIKNFLNL